MSTVIYVNIAECVDIQEGLTGTGFPLNLIGAAAVTLPGAHVDDNGPIMAGKLVETRQDASGAITLDVDKVRAGGERMKNNTGIDAEALFVEPGGP